MLLNLHFALPKWPINYGYNYFCKVDKSSLEPTVLIYTVISDKTSSGSIKDSDTGLFKSRSTILFRPLKSNHLSDIKCVASHVALFQPMRRTMNLLLTGTNKQGGQSLMRFLGVYFHEIMLLCSTCLQILLIIPWWYAPRNSSIDCIKHILDLL
jgi:hypothetical protein